MEVGGGGGKYQVEENEGEDAVGGFLVEGGGGVAAVQVAARDNAAFHISEDFYLTMMDYFCFGDDDDCYPANSHLVGLNGVNCEYVTVKFLPCMDGSQISPAKLGESSKKNV